MKSRRDREDQYTSPVYVEMIERLAANLVELRRKRRRWTQEEAAHHCDMDIRVLQRVERAEVNVTFATLARLCTGFDVDIARLTRPVHSPGKRLQRLP